ncbi:MAG: hypothetical protein H6619_02340 [Deltaproteobacteria bacterium]|nr:hypothetical protein [Deltaproteobacteria bacterium]
MFRFLVGFFGSLLITNWIYSEITLFYPDFEAIAEEFTESFSLPTHLDLDGLEGYLLAADHFLAGSVRGAVAMTNQIDLSSASSKTQNFDDRYRLYEMVTDEDMFSEPMPYQL